MIGDPQHTIQALAVHLPTSLALTFADGVMLTVDLANKWVAVSFSAFESSYRRSFAVLRALPKNLPLPTYHPGPPRVGCAGQYGFIFQRPSGFARRVRGLA
jgi:hypothetical protein